MSTSGVSFVFLCKKWSRKGYEYSTSRPQLHNGFNQSQNSISELVFLQTVSAKQNSYCRGTRIIERH